MSLANKESGRVRERTKQSLISAYRSYLRREPGAADRLMKVVMKLAYAKVYHLEYEFKDFGTTDTADDWAQNIALIVWRDLDKFRGTAEGFYPWVHRICFNASIDAFNEVKAASVSKIPLFTISKEDGSEIETNLSSYLQEGREVLLRIPESIQGVDLNICKMVAAKMTYAQVGEMLNMNGKAVEIRMRRLRNRMIAERKAAKEAGKPTESGGPSVKEGCPSSLQTSEFLPDLVCSGTP